MEIIGKKFDNNDEEVDLNKLIGLLRDAGVGEDILVIEDGNPDEYIIDDEFMDYD